MDTEGKGIAKGMNRLAAHVLEAAIGDIEEAEEAYRSTMDAEESRAVLRGLTIGTSCAVGKLKERIKQLKEEDSDVIAAAILEEALAAGKEAGNGM